MSAPTILPALTHSWPADWPSLTSWPSPDLVLYHDKCPDGFGAAFSVWKAIGDSATYIGCKHGDELQFTQLEESVRNAHVLVVDFSFGRERIERWKKLAKSFLVLDHHMSAFKEIGDVPGCYFEMGKSGARLAWEFMATGPQFSSTHGSHQIPPLISFIEDKDLWRWKLDGSKEFNAAMELVPFKFEQFDTLLQEESVHRMIEEGRTILKFKEEVVRRIAERSSERLWTPIPDAEPIRALVVNSPVFQSEIGNYLASAAATDPAPLGVSPSFHNRAVAVIWNYDHEARAINVSLRSYGEDAPDVSAIAKRYGGGGHPRASGLRLVSASIESLFE